MVWNKTLSFSNNQSIAKRHKTVNKDTMAAPNEEEYVQIEKFRIRLEDLLTTDEARSDQYLIRWIRAREHDLEKAEEMLRNHLTWREENNADHALETECDPFFPKNFPYWVQGFSREGHPVLEMPVGSWDVRMAVARPNGVEEFMLYTTQYFERALSRIRQRNLDDPKRAWPVSQIIQIVDWAGYSYTQLMHWKAMQSLLSMGSKYEAHYPEVIFKAYFINCPSIFPIMFSMMRPFLASNTIAKVSIFGCNREEWEPAIREWVDPDQLGVQFGGICLDRTVQNLQ